MLSKYGVQELAWRESWGIGPDALINKWYPFPWPAGRPIGRREAAGVGLTATPINCGVRT